jgi:hypothetical protein
MSARFVITTSSSIERRWGSTVHEVSGLLLSLIETRWSSAIGRFVKTIKNN